MIDYAAIEDAIIAAIDAANTSSLLGLVEVGALSAATADYESLDGANVRTPGAYVVIGGSRTTGNTGSRGSVAESVAVTVALITYDPTQHPASRRAVFPVINALVPAILAAPGLDWKPEYTGFDFTLARDGVVIHEMRFTVKSINRQ